MCVFVVVELIDVMLSLMFIMVEVGISVLVVNSVALVVTVSSFAVMFVACSLSSELVITAMLNGRYVRLVLVVECLSFCCW